MKTKLHPFSRLTFLLVCVFTFCLGNVYAQDEITVDPGFNTLYDAVVANPGSTIKLQREGLYIIDKEIEVNQETLIYGEASPADKAPAVVQFFANPGEGSSKYLFAISANCTIQDIGLMGFTTDDQQIKTTINLKGPGLTILTDGCIFQGSVQAFGNGQDSSVIIQQNNIHFNETKVGWDNHGGFGGALFGGNDNIYKTTNCTFFTCGRVFNNAGTGPLGSQAMDHNSYFVTWGDVFFPMKDEDVIVTNNLFYDAQVRGYVGLRVDAVGDTIYEGDFHDWPWDTISGDISIYPHSLDTVGTEGRTVAITNNMKSYSPTLLNFHETNNVTTTTLFNKTGYEFANLYGWNVENNILWEDGNNVDPQLEMGVIPEEAYKWMFQQRIERSLPANQQGDDFPYQLVWRPNDEAPGTFIWPLPFELKATNTELWFAGSDGYPLGDLNWFGEDVVAAWEAGEANPLSTGISSNNSSDLNLTNYPNPFIGSTTISYNLLAPSRVTIKVYNTIGAEVAMIVDTDQIEGKHSFEFSGESISQGIYFCVMQIGDFENVTRKIIKY